jgi:putative endonuclease
MYFLYILKCTDGSLYTGITTDVARRLAEHKNKAGGHYTRAHKADSIVYTEECNNRSEASKREAQIKRMSREDKIKLIRKELT